MADFAWMDGSVDGFERPNGWDYLIVWGEQGYRAELYVCKSEIPDGQALIVAGLFDKGTLIFQWDDFAPLDDVIGGNAYLAHELRSLAGIASDPVAVLSPDQRVWANGGSAEYLYGLTDWIDWDSVFVLRKGQL